MQPPARERPPSSSRSQTLQFTIEDDDGGETNGSAALVSPLENDDLVTNSLLLLPVLPSSLLRVSLVCKRWLRVLSSPSFLRPLAHHQKPPLLGLFYCNKERIIFTPMLDPPDEIPARRFALEVPTGTKLLCCHHGRVLMHVVGQQYFMVWEPITGELCRISEPPSFAPYKMTLTDAAIACASIDRGHVHGACHLDPFNVVVVAGDSERFYACVYSSETRAWGNLCWIMRPPQIRTTRATYGSQILRNSICFLLIEEKIAILEFDWSRQNLVIVDVPYALDIYDFFLARSQFFIKQSDAGGLSFVAQMVSTVHVWKRTSDGDGVATWILVNTFILNSILSLRAEALWMHLAILASDDDGNVLLRKTGTAVVYMVNLESRKFIKELPKQYPFNVGHPFSSFYTPGFHVNTGHDNGVQKIHGA